MIQQENDNRWTRHGFACALAILLGGCATFPDMSAPDWTDPKAQASEDGSFHTLLSSAPANLEVRLEQSPWGQDILAVLHQPYAAASGRRCRRLTLYPDSRPRSVLACLEPNTAQWQPVRLLQVNGRAILGAAPSPELMGITP
ncbi:DVU3141 family protein [Lamprobacter modestohalophilus]|uniref:DVU3141 family protein n=1 Tax=Lamprobacter modestohalophilus TaxID=1064514 RepID=UPI002ADEBFAC|nr:DVU3141 family protein [Lamprobacter modestohalophilus]MEA1052152.1 DVU3141 family protein [Lamprobacter modestohalophilus]